MYKVYQSEYLHTSLIQFWWGRQVAAPHWRQVSAPHWISYNYLVPIFFTRSDNYCKSIETKDEFAIITIKTEAIK